MAHPKPVKLDVSGAADDPDRPAVKSLRKALAVLNVVANADHPLTVANVAINAGIARPTAYRFVQTLVAAGYLTQDPADARLSVGFAVLPLASSLLDRNRMRVAALPHLQSLAQQTGERANLGILYRDRVMYVAGVDVEVAHEADPTRPVTQALFRPNVSHDYDDGLADLLDVVGQNYREKEILAAHEQKLSRKILGTENTHDRNQWLAVRDNAPYAGQFLWTGVDYLGETRRWPLIGHASGLLDRTGAIRPFARERQSWWSDAPMVAMARRVAATDLMPTDPGYGGEERHTQVLFSDWTPKDLSAHDENVEVYSNCKKVELFLNGKTLGAENIHADASPRTWRVPFAPGTLKAVARNDGIVAATDELRTAGQPAKIVLSTEFKQLSPGFDNVAVVRAKIVDADGIEIPQANNLVSFQISGPGVIAAVDNADNSSHELFQANARHAFQGECVAFVKATAAAGKIRLTATVTGLASGSLSIKTSK